MLRGEARGEPAGHGAGVMAKYNEGRVASCELEKLPLYTTRIRMSAPKTSNHYDRIPPRVVCWIKESTHMRDNVQRVTFLCLRCYMFNNHWYDPL